jgi:C4-type Zn-finger protein
MPSAWCTCPVCGDEIEMEVKSMAGGYDGEFLIEIELDTQYCDCKLTDEQWETVRKQAEVIESEHGFWEPNV